MSTPSTQLSNYGWCRWPPLLMITTAERCGEGCCYHSHGETGAGAALQAIVRLGTGFDANFTMKRETKSNNHHQAPLSTGLLYPKFQVQTSGIIQKLYETKTNTNTGWFKSVYWLFSEIKPKMWDFPCFCSFSAKNGLKCKMTFR